MKKNIALGVTSAGCPCKADCPKRSKGCHSVCREYMFWVRKNQLLYLKKLEETRQTQEGWEIYYDRRKRLHREYVINGQRVNGDKKRR